MKRHVLAKCESCRAGGTTVDAGGFHGIDEGVIGIFFAMDHRLPTVLASEIGSLGFVFQFGGHRSLPFEPAFIPTNRPVFPAASSF
jgi:hypothetical protein